MRTLWLMPGISVAAFAMVLILAARPAEAVEPILSWRIAPFLAASAALYMLAHVIRAVRIAVIAMPLLGLSFRTGFLLHLFVAPWSLIMPVKLDELVRLSELHVTGKSWPRAVIALLIDRCMDGAVLLILMLTLLAAGRSSMAGLLALSGLGLTAIMLMFFTLPVLLETVQIYVFQHHVGDRAVRLLRIVDYARRLLKTGRETILQTAPFLAITTLGVWSIEIAAVAILLAGRGTAFLPLDAIELMLLRAETSWRVLLLGQTGDPWATLLTLAFFAGLILMFVPAILLYARRRAGEPLRTPAVAPTRMPVLRAG